MDLGVEGVSFEGPFEKRFFTCCYKIPKAFFAIWREVHYMYTYGFVPSWYVERKP